MSLWLLFLLLPFLQGAPIGNLYLPDDDVEILDSNDFNKFVPNSPNAWFVEFYASWCGYCQRFAPIWKEFATVGAPWRKFVRIGVVECSDDGNTELCRKFGISKYPTVRYFHQGFKPNDTGIVVNHDEYTLSSVKSSVFKTILKEIDEKRGEVFPDLRPFASNTLDTVFVDVPEKVEFIFFIFDQDANDKSEILLDLHQNDRILLRQVAKESKLFESLAVKETALLVIDRKNETKLWTSGLGNKDDIKTTIRTFLSTKNIPLLEEIPSKLKNYTISPDPKQREKLILRQYIKKMGDVIFQADLESALRYSLQQEVATVDIIKDDALKQLQNYFKILKKYFPFAYNNTALIDSLIEVTNTTEIKGSLIEKTVKENGVFSTLQGFLGCQGSSNRFRGYPCSLWRLFHYLTVNSVLENIGRKNINPLEVLEPVHGYVKNFFSCQHCSKHFQQMAAERKMVDVKTLQESAVWLWEAHNVVNERLKGDVTEDPEYVKEHWPLKRRCTKCYKEEGWDKNEVFEYLKRVYGKYGVSYIGADTRILFPGLS